MDTDMALGTACVVGLTFVGICVLVNAWRNSRPTVTRIKQSDSDTNLAGMVPSQRTSNADDPEIVVH